MTNKKTFFALILSAVMCVPFTTSAQVTIGSGDAPRATLDVVAAEGIHPGIIHPNVTRAQLIVMPLFTSDQRGAVVYVTNANVVAGTTHPQTANITAVGLHFFDGNVWQPVGERYTGVFPVRINNNNEIGLTFPLAAGTSNQNYLVMPYHRGTLPSTDLNEIRNPGFYRINVPTTNGPVDTGNTAFSSATLLVMANNVSVQQILFHQNERVYSRRLQGNHGWTDWIDLTANTTYTAGNLITITGANNAINVASSADANRVIGVTTANSAPQYLQVNQAMMVGAGSTTGQVLTSTGATTSPTWQTLAAGWQLGGNTATATTNILGTTNAQPLRIRTGTGEIADTERMRIATTGNVGIGTTTTTHRLQIAGGSTNNSSFTMWQNNAEYTGSPVFRVVNQGTSTTLGEIRWGRTNAVTANASAAWIRATLSADGADGSLIFATRTGGTNAAERMRIHTNGFVGIGTAAPTQRLDVAGNVRVRESLAIGTDTPTARLDVNGQVRIRGGTPRAGRVLTAIDSEGNATWQEHNEGFFYHSDLRGRDFEFTLTRGQKFSISTTHDATLTSSTSFQLLRIWGVTAAGIAFSHTFNGSDNLSIILPAGSYFISARNDPRTMRLQAPSGQFMVKQITAGTAGF